MSESLFFIPARWRVFKKYLLIFIIFFLMGLSIPASLRADQYYPFIKADCNKAAKTMNVSMAGFRDPEQVLSKVKSGKIKGVYYMIDLSKERRAIKCNLGNNQDVSVIARHDGSHMANDNLGFYFNGLSIYGFILNQYDKFSIKALGSREALLRACPTYLWAAAKEEIRKADKDGCLMIHFKNGKANFE